MWSNTTTAPSGFVKVFDTTDRHLRRTTKLLAKVTDPEGEELKAQLEKITIVPRRRPAGSPKHPNALGESRLTTAISELHSGVAVRSALSGRSR